MRKVNLRMNEQSKYDVIKRVANNEISCRRASVCLNLSLRSIYRLVKTYKTKGKEGFVHGNRNRKPITTFSDEIKNKIVKLYNEKYYDSNYKFFMELLEKNENIKISYFALYKLLTENKYLSPKARRHTVKEYNKSLRTKKENNVKLNDVELDYLAETNLDDNVNFHPRKSRAKYFGELIQMDACLDYWFGDTKTQLHAAIDDATGRILALYFDLQETLNGYYHLFYDILTNYGIPVKFLTDNRTVFYYNNLKHPKPENDTLTQFSYACKILGTVIETTSIPQVKGRVERLFNTLLGRIPTLLRLAGVNTIDAANAYLKGFIQEFNKQFATPDNYTQSVFEKQDDINKINYALSIISTRKVDKGSTIKYKNKYYQFYNDGHLVGALPGCTCCVMETFNGELVAAIGETIYDLFEFERNKEVSSNFDLEIKKEDKPKRTYKPHPSHPWGYKAYIKKVRRYYATKVA